MNLNQFKSAPSLTLLDMLMNACTNNSKDAIYALRREYDFDLKNINRDEGDIFEFDGINFRVWRTEDDILHVNAEYEGWVKKLCEYTETSRTLINEPAFEKPEEEPADENYEGPADCNPADTASGPACESMEQKVAEQIEHDEALGEVIGDAMDAAMVNYTPGEDIGDEDKEGENNPPETTDSDTDIDQNDTPVGERLAIPETQDAAEEQAATEADESEPTTVKLSDHKPLDYLNLLFGQQYVNWLDVKNYLWNNDYREAAYKLTGTIPVEHCVIYDDYTFSIINLNNGNCFRILVAVTDDSLEQHEFLHTCDNTDRWMFVADICNNTAFNYGQYQEVVHSADWGRLQPGTMINL